MPFEKGHTLSKGKGRPPKGTALTDRLRAKMHKRADELAETLIGKALDGDMQAIREIFDRMEGKPAQAIQADVSGGLTVEVVRYASENTE